MTTNEPALPRAVDVFKLCQQTRVLEGPVQLSSLSRLKPLIEGISSADLTLSATLSFGRDDEGHRVVNGSLRAELPLVCQRCMEAMTYEVVTDFSCAFVATDDQAKALPAHLEPVMLQDDSSYVDLHELLEDELLLNLPIAALHEQCNAKGEMASHENVEPGQSGEAREKPFAALASLLDKER